ncbi:MAG: formylglycine-generating enzyme family protein [Anaerolineaceae bacterium]|nr:formylglycine-generating enzyme family protein [Anaerolineaceae bacterium]
MSRNYGNLRGRRSGAWQWLVMGFIFGFGCAAVFGLVIVIGGTSGLLNTGFLAALNATTTPVIITATPLPVTPTPLPTEVLAPSVTAQEVQVVAPTATPPPPTQDTASVQVEPSATLTATLVSVIPTQPTSIEAAIPPELLAIRTQTREISGGTFMMGTTPQEVADAVRECVDVFGGACTLAMGEDSSPPHPVTVNTFEMEVTEVTLEQYLTFLNSSVMGPNSHRNRCFGQVCLATRAEDPGSNVIFDSANYRVVDVIKNFPVVNVTWYGAQAYCEAIGRRLPTEAEWEYAARGEQGNLYPWGNTFSTDYAKTNRPVTSDPGAGPVDSYAIGATSFGILNMAGNVAEWVSDWYSPVYYTQLAQTGATTINPQGPVAGTNKVLRGGSWDTVPFFARSVQRQDLAPNDQTLWAGFRCVADATPTANTTGVTPLTGQNPVTTTGGSNEETTANSQPTLAPLPPTATLQPG